MEKKPGPVNRGATHNPVNRFVRLHHERDPEAGAQPLDPEDDEAISPRTQFFRDTSRSILAHNDSPDVGFSASINPYRGCEHGCVYCYARPTHEYFGLSAGLDFESMIFVKEEAPELLRAELLSPRWQPQVIAVSGVTDAYQPIERRLELTRRCLEVLVEFRNPVAVVTKSRLVTRDVDLLAALAKHEAALVYVSITTLDPELQRALEPRAPPPERRLATIEALVGGGVPVGVIIGPVIPGLNDREIPEILERAARAGARDAAYTVLRLPNALTELFTSWLEERFPDRKSKVLSRIQAVRGGRLNDPRFGSRMRGEGIFAEQIAGLFRLAAEKAGLARGSIPLSAAAFRRPGLHQTTLFDLFGKSQEPAEKPPGRASTSLGPSRRSPTDSILSSDLGSAPGSRPR